MIPGPLVVPLTAPPGEPRARVVTRAAGTLLIVLALTGAWAWFTVLSPFGFERWEVFETSSTVVLEPGTYVLYEEFDGASGDTSRPPLTVFVRSIAGREVEVTPLLGPAADDPPPSPPEPYQTPWHDGRPTSEFRIDRAGTYTVTAFPSETSRTALDYNELLSSFVAVAPAGEPGALGSSWGLLVVVYAPLLLGLAALAIARFCWPRPRRGRPRPYPG